MALQLILLPEALTTEAAAKFVDFVVEDLNVFLEI
jgi:hypothetical protein